MGVDNMVMMVKITATPAVLEEMRNSNVLKADITKMMTIVMVKNKLMIWRADSGIVHPSSSSPLGHWAIMSHLTRSVEGDVDSDAYGD